MRRGGALLAAGALALVLAGCGPTDISQTKVTRVEYYPGVEVDCPARITLDSPWQGHADWVRVTTSDLSNPRGGCDAYSTAVSASYLGNDGRWVHDDSYPSEHVYKGVKSNFVSRHHVYWNGCCPSEVWELRRP